tara:strand:- start:31 stop:498 length:468 start_codon:yes stop_codon:yes gene_type:complete
MTQLTDNFNMLSPTGFRVTIESPKFSNLEYFISNVSLPTITLSEAEASFRNYQGFVPGDKVSYEPLDMSFVIDEDMKNYTEVFNWIKSNADENVPAKHDLILSILTSHNNVNKQIKFVNAMPTSLGGVEFNTQVDTIDYLQSAISFRYDYFEIIR